MMATLLTDNTDTILPEPEVDVNYSGDFPKQRPSYKDGYLFNVDFKDCCFDKAKFDNGTLIDVSFSECSFHDTTWSVSKLAISVRLETYANASSLLLQNIFMRDVEVIGCIDIHEITKRGDIRSCTGMPWSR